MAYGGLPSHTEKEETASLTKAQRELHRHDPLGYNKIMGLHGTLSSADLRAIINTEQAALDDRIREAHGPSEEGEKHQDEEQEDVFALRRNFAEEKRLHDLNVAIQSMEGCTHGPICCQDIADGSGLELTDSEKIYTQLELTRLGLEPADDFKVDPWADLMAKTVVEPEQSAHEPHIKNDIIPAFSMG